MSQQEIDRREAHLQEDPQLLSPPTIEPPYGCAIVVQVLGGVANAKIEVEVNGTLAGSGIVQAVLPYGITISVAKLSPGDKIRARQLTSTAKSDWSMPSVIVRDHTKDFPAGPPRPELFPLPLYQ